MKKIIGINNLKEDTRNNVKRIVQEIKCLKATPYYSYYTSPSTKINVISWYIFTELLRI